MALQPSVYATLLREKIARHKAQCWLVNTGWIGGPYGVGSRVKIAYTRAMVRSILNGKLAQVPTKADPVFGLHIPQTCEDVPSKILWPKTSWKNPGDYDAKARDLAKQFEKNFEAFSPTVSEEVCASGPKVR
jgi:phosphoenolpyruvate carboxykinase (ATP)